MIKQTSEAALEAAVEDVLPLNTQQLRSPLRP